MKEWPASRGGQHGTGRFSGRRASAPEKAEAFQAAPRGQLGAGAPTLMWPRPGTNLTLAVLAGESFHFPDILEPGNVNYRATARVQTPELQLPRGETLDKLWELVSFSHCDHQQEKRFFRHGLKSFSL